MYRNLFGSYEAAYMYRNLFGSHEAVYMYRKLFGSHGASAALAGRGSCAEENEWGFLKIRK